LLGIIDSVFRLALWVVHLVSSWSLKLFEVWQQNFLSHYYRKLYDNHCHKVEFRCSIPHMMPAPFFFPNSLCGATKVRFSCCKDYVINLRLDFQATFLMLV
jgi:hypothetical protein